MMRQRYRCFDDFFDIIENDLYVGYIIEKRKAVDKMSKNILLAYDGSANATKALKQAIDIAKLYGAKLIVLNVQYSMATPHTKAFFSAETIAEYQQVLASDALASALEVLENAGIDYITKVRIGLQDREIVEEARQSEALMIVMGSRGLSLIHGKIMGSVSYGVLHSADRPVLIVPE